jgi:mRNA interferase MazF
MISFSQGDIISISGYGKKAFLIVSKNDFIKATGVFHICPIMNITTGPLHIEISGNKGITGTVICEQIKLIDPTVRGCSKIDNIPYSDIMNISDAIQGMFEYD